MLSGISLLNFMFNIMQFVIKVNEIGVFSATAFLSLWKDIANRTCKELIE